MENHQHSQLVPFSGYLSRDTPLEDEELTHVGPGTPAGEYLRRFWQPIAMSSEIGDRPVTVKILGEALVAFRLPSGEVGLVHQHCPHRGASLEYGIVEEQGLRCAYHGWLIAQNGTVLESPSSHWACRLVHGAYPVHEYHGLVFAYMGPPEQKPAFPLYDTTEDPGTKLVPFSFTTPCNWLQIGDNGMDPIHASYLHMIGYPQFGAVWTEVPELDFRETPLGMVYVATARAGDRIWVRSNDAILPNISQSASNWVNHDSKNFFSRASMFRWKTPVNDGTTLQLGWRMFNEEVDPDGHGDESRIGKDSIDVIGQTVDEREYEERQAMPSDYDILISQRRIAIHKLEHIGAADRGVVMLRRLIRKGIEQIRNEGFATPLGGAANTPLATYAHDTLLDIPPASSGDDRDLLREVASAVSDAVIGSADAGAGRSADVKKTLRTLMT